MDFSDAFAFVLQRRRLAKGLSRSQLAELAGLHQTYVGLIERGERNPSLDISSVLAEALGIPFSKLIAEAEVYRKSSGGKKIQR